MAENCNIIKDDKGRVVYTEAPNGRRSMLFDNLADKLGDKAEALKVWLITKTKAFNNSILNPIKSKYKSQVVNGIKESIDPLYKPKLVKTKDFITIFINRSISGGVLPSIRFNEEQVSEDIKDGLNDFLSAEKITTQAEILKDIKSDITLLKKREEASKKVKDFEELISDTVGKGAKNKSMTRLQELILFGVDPITGVFLDESLEQLNRRLELAAKGLNIDGTPSELANEPSNEDFTDSFNITNFERLAKENPELSGVYKDWKKLVDEDYNLSVKSTKGMRSYSLEKLEKLERYLESGNKIKIIDINSDPSESLGRIRFKKTGPNTFTVYSSLVKSGMERQGIGTQLYLRLLQFAAQNGMSVESSDELTTDSEGMWNKLVRMGLARQVETDVKITPTNSSNPSFEKGSMMTFTKGGGTLEIGRVSINGKVSDNYSILSLYVDEGNRRQGIASDLIREALRYTNNNLTGQASNEGAVIMNYKLGMRYKGDTSLNLEETLEKARERTDISINMVSTKASEQKASPRYIFEYKNPELDSNGEVSMGKVLNYTDRASRRGYVANDMGAKLDLNTDSFNKVSDEFKEEMKAELKDMMLGLPVSSSEELQSKMQVGFFSEGYFNPTRESLEASGLYRSEEITEILTDEDTLNNIKDFMYDLENVEDNILNDVYAEESYLVVKNGYKNRMGKFILANPYLVEQKVLDILAGIETRDEFEAELFNNEELEILHDSYFDNYETKDDLFYKFKSYTKVSEIEVEGTMLSAKTNNTRTHLTQVLQEPKDGALEENIDYLLSIDEEIYEGNKQAVDKVVGLVKKEMLEIGLDVTNLENARLTKTTAEFKQFLNAVQTFIRTESDSAFDNLVGEYNNFFNVDTSFKTKPVDISKNIKQENSFFLRTNLSPIKLFRDVGLIPIGNNVYKRLSKDMDLDMMYEKVYNMTVSGGYSNILSEEAFRPSGFDQDGTINLSKITDPNNKENIIRDMKSYIQSQISEVYTGSETFTSEELQKYVLSFNYINKSNDVNKFNQTPKINSELTIFNAEINNIEYLQTDFIADFNVKMLKAKDLNNLEYQEFFSNFEITETGIELKSNDPITMSKIDKYLDDNRDLVDYLRLKKQGVDLMPSNEQMFKDDLFRRNYYSNYPTALKSFKGDYTKLSEITILANSKDTFLRTKDGLFELNQGVGGKGIYTRLETHDGEFKVYNNEMTPADVDIDMTEVSAIETTFNTDTEIRNTYSKEEKDQIDKKHDNC